MAPYRILIVLILFFLSACASTKEAQVISPSKKEETLKNHSLANRQNQNLEADSGIDLDHYRNTLADINSQKNNDMPPSLIVEEKEPTPNNEYQSTGYRIQIISTPNRALAEKMMSEFNDWLFSDTTILYKAESYIQFRQPNYRVHIGDFKTRVQANDFIKTVKRRFGDAWIIQDQIDEDKTPDKF